MATNSIKRKMARRTIFVVLIGVDGAGKSTQARELRQFLARNGVRCRHVTNQYESWALNPLLRVAKRVALRGKDMQQDYDKFSEGVTRLFRNRVAAAAYLSYCTALQVVHTFFAIALPLAFGNSIVCERYAYDLIVRMAVEHKFSHRSLTRVLGWMRVILPRPHVLVFVDIATSIAYSRKDDVPALKYLDDRQQVYRFIAAQEGAFTLDGTRNPQELADEIRAHVLRTLPQRRAGV